MDDRRGGPNQANAHSQNRGQAPNNSRGGESGAIVRSSARDEGQGTDILVLIDHLEDILNNGTRVPFSSRVMVEEEDLLAVVDQLRLSLPQELKQARKVVQDRQRIITDAQAQADSIVTTARNRAEYILTEQGLTNEAKVRSEEMLRKAKDNVKRVTGEVDVYALGMMTELETLLQDHLDRVQHAKRALTEDRDG